MQINDELLHAFVHCHYKAYRKEKQEAGIISEYEILAEELKQTQKVSFKKLIFENKKLISVNASFNPAPSFEGISLDVKFNNANIHLILDGIEHNGQKSIIPLFITPFEKVTKTDKMFLALQASFIQSEFNLRIENCKVVYGKNLKQTKFRLSIFTKAIKKSIADLRKIYSSSNPPVFFKNPHCQVCEFKNNCLEKLVERDDLSLLAGLKPKEILQKNNRGIFFVKQLSYQFRPKKNPYKIRRNLPELKALAIRENKIYVQEKPVLPNAKTEIYLDIESIPDRDFHYLIGALVKEEEKIQHFSFWADNTDNAKDIFIEFITLLIAYNDFIIFHFGSYESQVLRKMIKNLPGELLKYEKIILSKCYNVLNVFNHIYPPTYTNTLKEISRFLGFDWTAPNASGIQSIVWRWKWELEQNEEYKTKLIRYNLEDCEALEKIITWIKNIDQQNIKNAIEAKNQLVYNFGKRNHLITDYNVINKYSYFDYQRNKIYLKTSKTVKKAIRRKDVLQKSANKIDKVIIHTSSQCPYCGSKHLRYVKSSNRIVVDLKFMKNGIKKWVVNNILHNNLCKNCKKQSVSKKNINYDSIYGQNIVLWSIYQHVQYNLSLDKIIKMLGEMFYVNISHRRLHDLQSKYIQKYFGTYEEIKKELISGTLIHADETKASVKDLSTGYVWVFANIDSALYVFKPNRESDFLQDLLSNFTGVLITDFYAGYDAIKCAQQKCLIHLIRDINEDLLKNQLNLEFKDFAVNFGHLLRNILETVDKYGLKKRNLSKHRREVQNYFSKLNITEFETEITSSYQRRLLKNKEKLFTFMEYDGIPWNNNNAENAIKSFAYYRQVSKNQLREKGMSDYLVWLSILQTCKYRGINFFEFLKSGETSISEFSAKKRR
jgi:predicted RecB family nuclease